MEWNGVEWSGMELNGVEWSGMGGEGRVAYCERQSGQKKRNMRREERPSRRADQSRRGPDSPLRGERRGQREGRGEPSWKVLTARAGRQKEIIVPKCNSQTRRQPNPFNGQLEAGQRNIRPTPERRARK